MHFFPLCKFVYINLYFLVHFFVFGDTTRISRDLSREAPNSMTKLATSAKCRTASTVSSAPAFLDSPWTLGLSLDSESAFKNLILQDLDVMMYYFDTDTYYKNKPISIPGDLKDMATIFTRITLLLVGADACTLHIINSVWGEDDDARLAHVATCPSFDVTYSHSPK